MRGARDARNPGHLSSGGNQPPNVPGACAVSDAYRPAQPRAASGVDRARSANHHAADGRAADSHAAAANQCNATRPSDNPAGPALGHDDQAIAATSPTSAYILVIINVDYDHHDYDHDAALNLWIAARTNPTA